MVLAIKDDENKYDTFFIEPLIIYYTLITIIVVFHFRFDMLVRSTFQTFYTTKIAYLNLMHPYSISSRSETASHMTESVLPSNWLINTDA